jgi:hypothetical protein
MKVDENEKIGGVSRILERRKYAMRTRLASLWERRRRQRASGGASQRYMEPWFRRLPGDIHRAQGCVAAASVVLAKPIFFVLMNTGWERPDGHGPSGESGYVQKRTRRT